MGLLLKLFYERTDPEGSKRAEFRTRRSLRSKTAPVPLSVVEQRWTSSSTLNAHIPRFYTPPEQRRTPPPPYTIVDPQDRLPRHPQPGSICTSPPQGSHTSNVPRDDDPRRIHPSGVPMRLSSASPLVALTLRNSHAYANIRRHQSTPALRSAAPYAARYTGPQITTPTQDVPVPDSARAEVSRLHRRSTLPPRPSPSLCRHQDRIRLRQSTTALHHPHQQPYQIPHRYSNLIPISRLRTPFDHEIVTLRWQQRHEAERYERRLERIRLQQAQEVRLSMPLQDVDEVQRWVSHIGYDCKYCRRKREGVKVVKRWL
jgi:hypothetical protein